MTDRTPPTQDGPVASPPQAGSRNYLADDIRAINDWPELPDEARRYVTQLADRIEAFTPEIDELTAESDDLTVEQRIRDYAVEHAINVLAGHPPKPAPRLVVSYAAAFAAYIDTGSKP